jgi:histone acetyltransferase MYST2
VRRKSSENVPPKSQKQETEKPPQNGASNVNKAKEKPAPLPSILKQKKPSKSSATTSEDETPQQRKQQQHQMTASSKNIVNAKNNDIKKHKRVSRSSQSSATSTTTSDDDQPSPQKHSKPLSDSAKKMPQPADKQIKSPVTSQKLKKLSKSSLHSSDDENPSQPNQSHHVATSKHIANAKKIVLNDTASSRRKSSTSQPKIRNAPPPITGGKVPPSVIKQQQQAQQQGKSSTSQPPLKRLSGTSSGNSGNSKSKKSIFSPVNTSSDSDDDDKRKKSSKTDRRASNGSNPVASSTTTAHPPPAPLATKPRGRGRPRKQPVEEVVSAADTTTTTTDSDSDTENDSSAGSRRAVPISSQAKKIMKKNQKTPPKQRSKDDCSDPEDGKISASQKQQLANIRKSTRKASIRKSKHLTGKSETDSDGGGECESVQQQRSQSKSPVKKSAAVIGKTATKAKSSSNVRKTEAKSGAKSDTTTTALPEERKCGVEGCDSNGHLGGQFDKHFMIEACPVYHNMNLAQTMEHLMERQKRDEERKKMSTSEVVRKGQLTNEQRQYQQRIKDIRSKFKPTSTTPVVTTAATLQEKKDMRAKEEKEEREANLNGIVSEYDLMLFREAQAVASENIENELRQYSSTKGTKFVAMGKFVMEVWYQSPYPEDAARIPKLYLCEFCLRYQKSEVGMKRHAAKCVWRHPPGDEVRVQTNKDCK